MAVNTIRKIIHIDEEKCTGCGLCIPSCHEGAIAIVDGKARLIGDKLCDGLGNCLGTCPEDAITIEEREAEAFDEEAVKARAAAEPAGRGFTCPSARSITFARPGPATSAGAEAPSQLGQWPVQLHLVPPNAPHFGNADLLLAADCVPVACGGFHPTLLAGRAVAIGCPKFDDSAAYLAKLTAILQQSSVRSITVAYMEVPCCAGLVRLAQLAVAASGRQVPVVLKKISIRGDMLASEQVGAR